MCGYQIKIINKSFQSALNIGFLHAFFLFTICVSIQFSIQLRLWRNLILFRLMKYIVMCVFFILCNFISYQYHHTAHTIYDWFVMFLFIVCIIENNLNKLNNNSICHILLHNPIEYSLSGYVLFTFFFFLLFTFNVFELCLISFLVNITQAWDWLFETKRSEKKHHKRQKTAENV